MTWAFRIWFSVRAETCSSHLTYGNKEDKNNLGCTESEKRVVLGLHLRSNGKKGDLRAQSEQNPVTDTVKVKPK